MAHVALESRRPEADEDRLFGAALSIALALTGGFAIVCGAALWVLMS